jgi:hypothetical protein
MAQTMGLITVEHELEFVVCPDVGGALITPERSLVTAVLDINSAGANANAPFVAWAIEDIIQGCGTFGRYEIVADAATAAYL